MERLKFNSGCEFGIAAPSFVGLAMTVQVIMISFGIETNMIKLEVIARIPMKSGDEAISPELVRTLV